MTRINKQAYVCYTYPKRKRQVHTKTLFISGCRLLTLILYIHISTLYMLKVDVKIYSCFYPSHIFHLVHVCITRTGTHITLSSKPALAHNHIFCTQNSSKLPKQRKLYTTKKIRQVMKLFFF